jgi:hypothetical protein
MYTYKDPATKADTRPASLAADYLQMQPKTHQRHIVILQHALLHGSWTRAGEMGRLVPNMLKYKAYKVEMIFKHQRPSNDKETCSGDNGRTVARYTPTVFPGPHFIGFSDPRQFWAGCLEGLNKCTMIML